MRFEIASDCLTVFLDGEIDHHSAQGLRTQIENLLSNRQLQTLILDFADVEFMDSSGVGMIIGRYKTMAARGGILLARGLSPAMDKLFHMAGLHRIISITPKCIRRNHE
ncbi:MAG: anti-sigma factor antagonist [Clostridia bacterium]|nr:anti-sigma factor antagonist [Clostridia bacterium]